MEQKRRNLLLTAAVAVILSVGLLVSFSPSVNLRDRILDMVQLPRKVFSYILGDHPTSPKEEVPTEGDVTKEEGENGAENAPQTPDDPQNAPPNAPQVPPAEGETVTTPIDLFTEDDPIDLTQPTEPTEPTESTEETEPPPHEEQSPSQTPNLPVNQLPDNILE